MIPRWVIRLLCVVIERKFVGGLTIHFAKGGIPRTWTLNQVGGPEDVENVVVLHGNPEDVESLAT